MFLGIFRTARPAATPKRVAQMTYELRCRECGKSWGNQPRSICDDCFSPLEVFYDYEAVRPTFTRERIAQGPASMWRYRDLLPLPANYQPRSSRVYPAARGATSGSKAGREASVLEKRRGLSALPEF